MSNGIDDMETEETVKISWFKRVMNAIWKGLKFCFKKFKAVFVFLGCSVIFGLFTIFISKSSVKEKKKKDDIKDAKETVDQTSEDIEKIKETVNETSENKKKQKEKTNKTQKEKAESLGFKKVK